MLSTQKLRSLQFAGQYTELLALTVDSPHFDPNPAQIPWVIGALSMLGRTAEAEGLYTSYCDKLDTSDRVVATFFYGISVCRERKLLQARGLFIQNFLSVKQPSRPGRKTKSSAELETIFFAYQGLAFYRYTSGYYRQAHGWALRALKTSSAASFLYGSAFAYEILGHIQLQLGDIRAGMKNLVISSEKAKKLGKGALKQSLDAAILLYKVSYGLDDAETIVAELSEALRKCRYEDAYTKASLSIHLARVFGLRGDLREASRLLDEASPLVYQVDNPYLDTLYNLGFATLELQKGNQTIALSMAKNASARAVERLQLPSQIKSLGLQARILDNMGLHRESAQIHDNLRALTLKTSGYIARRILARQSLQLSSFRRGEDPLGDLIDDIDQNHPDMIEKIVHSGWYGLLKRALKITPKSKHLIFDLQANSLTVFAHGQVDHFVEGCSHLIKKVLLELGHHSNLSKEDLTKRLWGQSYSPTRHDPLIYGLISRTRKLLQANSHWIEVSESGYCLAEGVKVTFCPKKSTSPKENEVATAKEVNKMTSSQSINSTKSLDVRKQYGELFNELNLRQIELLNQLDSGQHIRQKDLVIQMKVSDATASRDLSKLVDVGILNRRGAGRATYYFLSKIKGNQSESY